MPDCATQHGFNRYWGEGEVRLIFHLHGFNSCENVELVLTNKTSNKIHYYEEKNNELEQVRIEQLHKGVPRIISSENFEKYLPWSVLFAKFFLVYLQPWR